MWRTRFSTLELRKLSRVHDPGVARQARPPGTRVSFGPHAQPEPGPGLELDRSVRLAPRGQEDRRGDRAASARQRFGLDPALVRPNAPAAVGRAGHEVDIGPIAKARVGPERP